MNVFPTTDSIGVELENLGWGFYQVGPNEGDWLKFGGDGELLARSGDETWCNDLAIARNRVVAA